MASALVAVPHRPAGVYPLTNLMNIDGFFIVNMGRQHIQLTLRNLDQSTLVNARIHLEGISDPLASFTATQIFLGDLPAGSDTPVRFTADFTHATPSAAYVSFVVHADGVQPRRIIKKIFITRVDYNKTTKTYTVRTPQGDVGIVVHRAIMGSESGRCRGTDAFAVLLQDVTYTLTPSQPYEGPHGPLMYDDPWWKIALGILAGLIALGGALYDYFSDGTLDGGSLSVKGTFEETGPSVCCTSVSTSASSGEDDIIAKGLYGAAGTVASIAIASDDPDLHWRGQEATPPKFGELTKAESVHLQVEYIASPSPGRPFPIEGKWSYERQTSAGNMLAYSDSDRRQNTHVLDHYQVNAPATHDRSQGPLIATSSFYRPDGTAYHGGELFVTGHLMSDTGVYRQFNFDDSGRGDDKTAGDGTYTGTYWFNRNPKQEGGDPPGRWYLFVVAQDVNTVEEGTDPFDAAHTVGGLVVTTQLVLGIDQPCELNHDAVIQVV
jgi:hypothetical protein